MDRIEQTAFPEVSALVQEDEGTLLALADLFKMMSDPTRLRILAALSDQELPVGDIASQLDMSMSAVSHQLSLLRRARLVRWQRQGREVYYALDDQHIELLFRAGLDHCSHE